MMLQQLNLDVHEQRASACYDHETVKMPYPGNMPTSLSEEIDSCPKRLLKSHTTFH